LQISEYRDKLALAEKQNELWRHTFAQFEVSLLSVSSFDQMSLMLVKANEEIALMMSD